MMVNVSNFQTKVPHQQKHNTTKLKNDNQTQIKHTIAKK
jgi:hypothetical protein